MSFFNATIHTCVDYGVYAFVRGAASSEALSEPLMHPITNAYYSCMCVTKEILLETYPNVSGMCQNATNMLYDVCVTKLQPLGTIHFVCAGLAFAALGLSFCGPRPAPQVREPQKDVG